MYTPQQIIDKRKEIWQHKDIEKDKEYREATAQYILENPSLLEYLQDRPEYIIEMFFVIVDKEKKTVPFFLNDVQYEFLNILNDAIEEYRKGNRLHLKFLLLKSRQQGFTSFITAYQLACTIIKKNFEGFTLADSSDNSSTIFEKKAKFPYSKLPDILKPSEKYNNRKELLFDKLNSSWAINTATKDVGRSRTINFFHGSEAAFWQVLISDIQKGLGEALTQDAIQILESTANGYNEYKDLWDSGDYTCLFFEWWKTKEYRVRFENHNREKQFKGDVQTKNEWIYNRCKWLIEVVELEWEQVYWYYNKWKGYIDKESIKQEYPCTPDEAFLSSGRCVFDKEKIIERKEYLKRKYEKEPYITGSFYFKWNDPDTRDKIIDSSIKFVPNKEGFIRIYEQPKAGYPYVLGGDTKGEGKDFFAGTMINNITGNRCAVIHGQFTNSKPYTWQMYCLGMYYNEALIGIEMNFNTAPIEELERLRYPKQYVRQQYDNMGKVTQKKFGWKTDGNTRPLIIDKEIDLIEGNIELFNDTTMLDECLTFVYDEDNRPDAQDGKHDDVLFSDMIANEIRGQQTFEIDKEVKKKELPWFFQSPNDNKEGDFIKW